MVAVSIFGLYGAATGRLAAMLAAILAPSLLSESEQSKLSKLKANVGVMYPTQQACELVNGKGHCMSGTNSKTGKTVWIVNIWSWP